MLRTIVIGAVAAAGLLAVSGESQSVEAAHRVRINGGPPTTVVRWRGGRIAADHPHANRYVGSSPDVQVDSAGCDPTDLFRAGHHAG